MNYFKQALTAFAFSVILVSGAATAADRDWQKYDGSVKIDATQFALVIGGSSGGGTLDFQGKTYEFKLEGLTAGINVGMSKVEGNGFVYDLKDIAQFPGTYKVFSAGAAAVAGAGTVYLKNENGVIMTIGTTSEGLQLNLSSASGVKVKMK